MSEAIKRHALLPKEYFVMGLQRERRPGDPVAQVLVPALLLTCLVTWKGPILLCTPVS